MVYGEFVTKPSLDLAKLLAKNLPKSLNSTYFTNSGTEALEGSMKLARRHTGRKKIIAAKNAYHGSTMGALTLMGLDERKKPFEPLIPDVEFIEFNSFQDICKIDEKTSCVILETIQGSAGFILPTEGYLSSVKKKCKDVGALLILDEIQTGIGRTGKLFGFENFDCIPDIIVYGKGLGGGIPIGAFTSSKKLMDVLHVNPILGHITTIGANPVITAAALQTLKIVLGSKIMESTLSKEKLLRQKLNHKLISEIRGVGLMQGLVIKEDSHLTSLNITKEAINQGLLTIGAGAKVVRIVPPLIIKEKEVNQITFTS